MIRPVVQTIAAQLPIVELLGNGCHVSQRLSCQRVQVLQVEQAGGLAMDNDSYNLPHQTVEVLQSFQPSEACQNMGLLLDKYIPKRVFEHPDKKNPNAGKAVWLLDILKPRNIEKTQNNHIDSEFARNVYKRWVAMVQ